MSKIFRCKKCSSTIDYRGTCDDCTQKITKILRPVDYIKEGEILMFKKEPSTINMTLPTESDKRKEYPLFSGCLKYFPAALAGISNVSMKGNLKHNPGKEMHHARAKSSDHLDCIIRHLLDAQDLISQGADKEKILEEASSAAWRALAYSQELHEQFGAPLAPGAKK